MQGHPCPFGQAFLQTRTANSLSQWTVALRTRYHIRNIQRIEQGEHQPGIMLALRLAAAAEADVGEFFAALSLSVPAAHNPNDPPTTTLPVPAQPRYEDARFAGCKCLFGPLLHQARLAAGLAQAEMARKVQYSLRNISAVEKGRQEPGVMIALGMVTATGVDVKTFFNTLHALASAENIDEAPPGRLTR